MIIEEVRRTVPFKPESPTSEELLLLRSLPLSGVARSDIYSLYQGWMDRLVALEVAQTCGKFVVSSTMNGSAALRAGLEVYSNVMRQLTLLRARAMKERQINRRVGLNLEIQRLEKELESISQALTDRS